MIKLFKNNKNQIFICSILFAIATAIPFFTWYWATHKPWALLRNRLMFFNPVFLDVLFAAIIIAFVINAKNIWRAIKNIKRSSLIIVMIIAVSAGFISAFIAPRTNRLYYDEQIYENIGQNMALVRKAGSCNEGQFIFDEYFAYSIEYNKQPYGYPHLLSIIYRIFGVQELWAHILNNCCAVFAALIAFFLARWFVSSDRAGLFAALCMAIIPQQLIWCNSAAAEPSTMVIAGTGILALIFYLENSSVQRLLLAVTILAYAVYFRPESVFILIVAGFIVVTCALNEIKKIRLFLGLILLMLLIVPEIVHIAAVRNEGWGNMGGNKFNIAIFDKNLATNGWFYLKNMGFPFLVSLGALLTIFVMWSKPVRWRKIGLIIWFLLFWGVFLTFYAGSYNYGVDIRFSLVSYLPLAILSGFWYNKLLSFFKAQQFDKWHFVIVIMLLLNAFQFLPLIKKIGQEASGCRYDVKYAKEFVKLVPRDAIILTHNPNMFLVWGHSAAQMSKLTEHRNYFENVMMPRYKGGMYLHWNYWCNVPNPQQNSFAANITNEFDCKIIRKYKMKNFDYALMKLFPKSKIFK